MKDFKTLEIWKRAIILAKEINEITQSFPINEKFGLASQMKRSGVSIASNIAEGCGRRTVADMRQFIHIAIGSSFELETQIEIAFLSHYIENDTYMQLLSDLNTLQKKMISFLSGLGVRY
jgi:four helix bundle protein